MPRAALDTLPLDVTYLIFNHLRPTSRGPLHPNVNNQEYGDPAWYSVSLQPLLSLCLVSKRLCNLAQPFLHHEFLLGYGDSWRSNKFTWKGRLIHFMRTVARRRDLAAQVKRIYIHPLIWENNRSTNQASTWRFGWNLEFGIHSRFDPSDVRDVLDEAAGALGIDSLRTLSENDLIAVLILELPNLQHCSLQLGVDHDEVVPGAALRAAAISTLPIKTIDLDLCATSSEARKSFGKISTTQRAFSVLTLSMGLETLNLHQYYGVLSDERDPIPPLPNLKNLRLTFSWLNERTLQRLLSTCGSLRVFYYEATSNPERTAFEYYPPPMSTAHNHFRLADAVKHLSSHWKTLKSVHIDIRLRRFFQRTPEPWAPFNFEHFPTLQHLFLASDERQVFYMDSHRSSSQALTKLLPSSITSLCLAGDITGDLPRVEQSLTGLAEAVVSGHLPSLEVVRWDDTQRLSECFPVRTMFAAAGADFSYGSFPVTKSTLGQRQSIDVHDPNYWETQALRISCDLPHFNDYNYIPSDLEDPDL